MRFLLSKLVLILFFAHSLCVSAQSLNRLSVVFGASVQADIHSPSTLTVVHGDIIRQNSVIPFTPSPKSTITIAPEVNCTLPVSERLTVFTRIQYHQTSLSATSQRDSLPSLVRINGVDVVRYTVTEWQHQIDVALLNISAGLRYYVSDRFFIAGSGALGLVLEETSEASENIISGGETFPNGTRKNIVESNYTKSASIPRVGVNFGMGYSIPIDKGILITPEINYALALSSIRKDYGWTFNSIGAGVSINFALD